MVRSWAVVRSSWRGRSAESELISRKKSAKERSGAFMEQEWPGRGDFGKAGDGNGGG
jgi:hypothetical protein